MDDVVLRLRDDKPFSDRATTLGDHGVHGDAPGQGHADQPIGVDFVIQEQPILSQVLPAPCQPP